MEVFQIFGLHDQELDLWFKNHETLIPTLYDKMIYVSVSISFIFSFPAFFLVANTLCQASFLAKMSSSLPPFVQICHSLLLSFTASLTELSQHHVCLYHFPFFDKLQGTYLALSKLTLRCFHFSSIDYKIKLTSLSSRLLNLSWNLQTLSWSFNLHAHSLV